MRYNFELSVFRTYCVLDSVIIYHLDETTKPGQLDTVIGIQGSNPKALF